MEKKDTEFKIHIDKERHDHDFHEAKKDLRYEKLNQRVAIISILIPCIIIILIAYSYFDTRDKISGLHSSGIDEIQRLSRDFDKKISDLSIQYSKSEESFNKKLVEADKKGQSIKSNLENLIKKTEETKADKTEVSGAVSSLNSQLSSLKNDLASVSVKVKDINTGFAQKISDLSKAIAGTDGELSKLHADISKMSAGKADKKEMELLLRDQLKIYQNEINRLSREFDGKIEVVRKHLIDLEKKIEAKEAELKAAKPAPSIPAQQSKPDSLPKPAAASKSAAPKPGAIVEQDLK
jgi:DNA repair exonuclease SbcCD ATPase subunit